MARVFDQIALALLFLSSAFFVKLPAGWLRTLRLGVGGFLIVTVALLLVLLILKERFVGLLTAIICHFHWDRYRLIQRVLRLLDDVVAAFQYIQIKRRFVQLMGLSLVIWLGIFSVNFILLQAFHVPLSYIEVVLASTFIILLGIIPLQVLNGFGIHETTWVFIAVTLGVAKQTAIVAAFGTHIVSTLYLFGFGLYGLWRLKTVRRDSEEAATAAQKEISVCMKK
jgi:uncharacterized membrane protein YbhN (UPF0104 family)